MRRFSIYYNNGDVIHGGGDDDELVTIEVSKAWLEAPNDGVCHVVSEVPDTGRITLKDYEYYYQLPFNSHGEGDIGGSMKVGAYLRQIGLVKFGGWTSNKTFQAMARKARLDTWIPQVTGKRREQAEDSADE